MTLRLLLAAAVLALPGCYAYRTVDYRHYQLRQDATPLTQARLDCERSHTAGLMHVERCMQLHGWASAPVLMEVPMLGMPGDKNHYLGRIIEPQGGIPSP